MVFGAPRGVAQEVSAHPSGCLLYTSDAADERSSVDLGGRRIIKKKTTERVVRQRVSLKHNTSEKRQRTLCDDRM